MYKLLAVDPFACDSDFIESILLTRHQSGLKALQAKGLPITEDTLMELAGFVRNKANEWYIAMW